MYNIYMTSFPSVLVCAKPKPNATLFQIVNTPYRTALNNGRGYVQCILSCSHTNTWRVFKIQSNSCQGARLHAQELKLPSRLIIDGQFLERVNKNMRLIGIEKVILVRIKPPSLHSIYNSVLPNLLAIIGRTSLASTRDSRKGKSESNAWSDGSSNQVLIGIPLFTCNRKTYN